MSSEPVDIDASLALDYLKIESLKGRKRPPAIRVNIATKTTSEPISPMTNAKINICARLPTAESKVINKPVLRLIDEETTYDRLEQEFKRETGLLENIVT